MRQISIEDALKTALQYHRFGRLEEARSIYQQILMISPDNADALHLLGMIAYSMKEYEAAAELMGRAIQINPNYAEAHYNLGKVFQDQDRLEEAITSYQCSIAINPGIAEAHYNLGIIFGKQNRLDEAIASYRRAIAINPDDAFSHYNLGNLLQKQGRPDEAIASYQRAILMDPDYAAAYNNLGNLLQEQGKLDEAITSYRHAIKSDPNDAYLHYNLGNALQEQERFEEATASYQRAIAINPGYVEAYNNLGYMLQQQGRLDEAIDVYRHVLGKDPNNSNAAHMVAALTGQTTETAPLKYIKTLFDYFAKNFEYQLVEKLGYRSPFFLRQALDSLLKADQHFQNVIDLGCGAGLSGMAFRPIAKRLSGIDISPKMIEEARRKNTYDILLVGDIIDFLQSTDEKFDLFIATDVLVYIGNLKPIFSSIKNRALAGAYFVFLTESTDKKDYVLRPTGRYAHSPAYIQSLAREYNFEIAFCHRGVIRKHNDQEIMGDHLILRYLK